MNRNDHPGPLCDSLLDQFFIDIHGIRTDIHKHDLRSPEHKSICSGYKCVGRHDHLISRLDLREICSHLKCMVQEVVSITCPAWKRSSIHREHFLVYSPSPQSIPLCMASSIYESSFPTNAGLLKSIICYLIIFCLNVSCFPHNILRCLIDIQDQFSDIFANDSQHQEADAIVTAGSTGAYFSWQVRLLVGRIKGH